MGGGDQAPRWSPDPVLTGRERERRAAVAAAEAALQGRLLRDVQSMWRAVVGDTIADEAVPQAERDGSLFVACRSGRLGAEINLMADVILRLLNEQLDQPARGAPGSDGRRLRGLLVVGPG